MIVYDGLMSSYNISFGPGIRRSLNESYKEAKASHGIVTSLPMSARSMVPAKAPKASPVPKPPSREEKDETLHVIVGMIDQFCREHLNDEYAVLCRKLAEKLARKRPSPLLSGKLATWASGIVRTIGWVNFLGDPSQTPHMKMTDIDEGFGVSQASGSAKSKAIRDLLRMRPFDPEWTLPSRMEDGPVVESGQPGAGHVLERIHPMHQGRQQQALDETVVVLKALQLLGNIVVRLGPFPVHLQIDFMLLLQHGQELRLVELLGVFKVDPHHVGERFVAVRHNVPKVAQRDDITQAQRVPPVDQ